MKKFMKAIAFVTVMCMALSTVAFAAGSVPETALDKTFQVTVTGAGNEQVALMVVAAGAENFNTPLYIDQKPAVGGNATFTAVLTNTDVEAVDVYVGYASNQLENGKAPKIGTVKLVQPITEVTVSNVICTWNDYKGEGMEQNATGAVLEFTVAAPEGTAATKMVWAIDSAAFTNRTKYTEVYDMTDYGIGTIINNSQVKLGLAFLNGSDLNDIEPVEIENIRAYFLFVNSDNTEKTVEVKNN